MTVREQEKSTSAVTAEQLSQIIDELSEEKKEKPVTKKMSGLHDGVTVADLVKTAQKTSPTYTAQTNTTTKTNAARSLDTLIAAQMDDETQIQQVYDYVQDRNNFGKELGIYIGLLINCLSPLFMAVDLDLEFGFWAVLSILAIFAFIGIGVTGIIKSAINHARKKPSLRERIRLTLMNRESVKQISQEYTTKHFMPKLIAGILGVSIVPVIPLILFSLFDLTGVGLALMFLTIAVGVGLIITTSMTKAAFSDSLIADEENRSIF